MIDTTLRIRTSALALAAGVMLTASAAQAQSMPGEGVTVQPITSSIAEEVFQHLILFEGLKRLGYVIEVPLEAEYPTMHVALGNGDADFTGVHWDTLHEAFFERSGGEEQLVKLGTLVSGVLQGYLIDKATADEHGITSIDQLKDPAVAAIFDADGDGKADLTGCNPGWGCERVIEHHMEEYDLADTVSHNQGSYFALIADTIGRFERGEPILYYTWTPLWVSGVLVPGGNVEWLEVPYTSLPDGNNDVSTSLPDGRNVGFAVDNIRVLANRDFAEANPAAAKFLELAVIPVNDISAQNLLMQNGEDSQRDVERHAAAWIADNQAQFDAWVEEARKAAE